MLSKVTPASVTVASRIMLPANVVMTAALGVIYLLDPLRNLNQSRALTFPRIIMGGHMEPWGALFLCLAAFMAGALVVGSRLALCLGLCTCAFSFALWGVAYGISCRYDPAASASAPLWPFYVATACIASTVSLLHREV